MALVFTALTTPKIGSALADRNPDGTVTIWGTVNVGTHAANGVAITPALVNAGITDSDSHIASIEYVEIVGRSVDLTCSARYVRSSGKIQVALEDGTSGIHADASTADLSAAGKTFDCKVRARV